MTARLSRSLYGLYAWGLLLFLAPPIYLLVMATPQRCWRWKTLRLAAHLIASLCGVKVSVELPQPRGGPYVFVFNHESYLDTFVLVHTMNPVPMFVAGAALKGQRIAGPLLGRLGCAFIGGSEAKGRAGLAPAERALRDGCSVGLFAEGSLNVQPGLRRLHLGAFVLAQSTSCPVVPVALTGTRQLLPPGHKLPRRSSVEVRFGEPIAPRGTGFAGAHELAGATRTSLLALLAR